MLKRESELPLEDLLNQLPEEYLNNVETNVKINDKVILISSGVLGFRNLFCSLFRFSLL